MTQPRTVLNLVHSARSSCAKPSARSAGRLVRGHRAGGHRAASSVRPGRGGAELDRVPGELHVGLLEGRPVRRHLGERHPALAEQRHDRSAASPEMVSVSRSGGGDRGPRVASTVIASAGAVVRSVTRPPDAAAISSATLVSAMTRPRPTTTRWSAVSCSSLIRWLETSTARPWAASDRRKPAHPDDALGVHAVERLVQHQHRRVAEQRGGDAEPLPHAEGVAARLAPDRGLPGRPARHLIDPAGRQALGVGQPQQVVAGGPARLQRGGVQQRPDVAERVPQARGTAGRRSARCPRRRRPGRG
jgi:hypothetical protein